MIITGEFFTESVRNLLLEHKLSKAHDWFNNLRPRPKQENRKAVLFGDAEFIGITKCKNPKCDQCKGEKPFAMIFKENLEYKEKLAKHKKYIKKNYIEIDGDTIASKNNVANLVELQTKVDELKNLRNKDDDPEIREDLTLKTRIIDAEDHRDTLIEAFYQEHGVSTKYDYEIGSIDWKKKLEVDGLLELIKARSLGDKTVREILEEAKDLGEQKAEQVLDSRKELQSFIRNTREIKKKVKPSQETVKVGKYKIPKNILDDYVESVRAMRTSMIIGTSRQDPLIGANALALRIRQHRRIFEALKIPYHGDDKSNKKSQDLYDVVEKFIEQKYPELSLGSVGRSFRRKRKNDD